MRVPSTKSVILGKLGLLSGDCQAPWYAAIPYVHQLHFTVQSTTSIIEVNLSVSIKAVVLGLPPFI